MIKYYIKHAFRGLLKNKLFSAFNIIGFAVGFAVCIVIALFVYREYSVDSYFPNADRVYRLVDKKTKSTKIDQDIVPVLLERYPEIRYAAPVFYMSTDDYAMCIKQVKNKNYIDVKEFISTNNEFFRLAGLKMLVAKSSEPFSDCKSLVLSKSSALKLFGRIDVVDELVDVDGVVMPVSAVVEDIPSNSSMGADFFVHVENDDYRIGTYNTGKGTYYPKDIYITLQDDAEADSVVKKLNQAFPPNMSETVEVDLQPVRSIYFSQPYEDSDNRIGNKSMIWIIVTIAILTMIMSIFNYVNYAISKQLKTLKDAGVRITNGADSSQLKAYYIADICLSVFIAFLIALLISKSVLPLASQLLNTQLMFSWLLKPELLLFAFILLSTVILISAIVPLGFISRANLQVLFGKVKLGNHKYSVQSAMTVFQLAVSIILLSAFFIVNKQLSFVKTADVGFDKDRLLRIDLPFLFEEYDVLKQQLRQYSFIQNMSFTSHAPGASWQTTEVKSESGNSITIRVINIDKDFQNTFDVKLLKGRKVADGEINSVCYISEESFKKLEWDDFIGKKFNGKTVVGVLNNINVNSLHTGIVPVAFQYTDRYYNALNIRLMPGKLSDQMREIEKVWYEISPDSPFSFGFYDEFFNSLYLKEDKQAKTLTVFSIVALIITCIGLLGQTLQSAEKRVKEIGIRKINGATSSEIMRMLNSEFLVLGAVSVSIAFPVAWYVMDRWLQSFAYKTELSWWVFVTAGLITLTISLLTLSWQSWRAATCNPVETLRYE
ncbi:MAG: ABC transporter permease [Bacteroidales bacterium]